MSAIIPSQEITDAVLRGERVVKEAEGILRRWAEVAERAWRAGSDIATALEDAFSSELDDVDPEHRKKLETLNGIHSNAAGLQRWLETIRGRPD